MPMEIVGPSTLQLDRSIAQWVKDTAIATGEAALKAEVARGFDSQPVVITDGVPRRDYHDVKPFGTFEFARRAQMADAVLWALAELQRLSPIGPEEGGHYRDDHVVLKNGVQLGGDLRAELMNVKPDDRVQIVNTRIYARKIEGATSSKRSGRKRRKASSRQAPGGVYRVVQRTLLSRFGRVMFFDFGYVSLNTGALVRGWQGGGANRRRVLRNQVYPALKFFIKS